MLHLAVIQLMPVLKWLRSDSDGSCVNKMCVVIKGFTVKCHSIPVATGIIVNPYRGCWNYLRLCSIVVMLDKQENKQTFF